CLSRSALTMPRVSGVSGQCRLITSDRRRRSSSDTASTSGSSFSIGSAAITFIPKAHAMTPRLATDAAEADKPSRFALQFDERRKVIAPFGLFLPSATRGVVAMALHAVTQLQQQGEGKLGHGMRAVCGNVGYGNAPFGSRIYIDDIVAGGEHADEAQVW